MSNAAKSFDILVTGLSVL